MKKEEVTSLYLYTDNACNYAFYDRQNFQRIQEKAVNFGPKKISTCFCTAITLTHSNMYTPMLFAT